jgi:hypothetical protein
MPVVDEPAPTLVALQQGWPMPPQAAQIAAEDDEGQ